MLELFKIEWILMALNYFICCKINSESDFNDIVPMSQYHYNYGVALSILIELELSLKLYNYCPSVFIYIFMSDH